MELNFLNKKGQVSIELMLLLLFLLLYIQTVIQPTISLGKEVASDGAAYDYSRWR